MSKINKLRSDLKRITEIRKVFYETQNQNISEMIDIQNELNRVRIELSNNNNTSLPNIRTPLI
jgi:hypothetical protein